MSNPSIFDDGNFRVAAQNGPAKVTLPFADKGDFVSFMLEVPMRVDADYFRAKKPMSIKQHKLGKCYLVDMSDTTVVDRARLLDFTEIYASVPVTRIEKGSFVTSRNVSEQGVGKGFYTSLVSGDIIFEYFLGAPPEPIIAQRVFPGFFIQANAGAQAQGEVPPGQSPTTLKGSVVGKNSIATIWKGQIYERQSFFYKPSPIIARTVA